MTIAIYVLIALVLALGILLVLTYGRVAALKTENNNAFTQILALQSRDQEVSKQIKKFEEKLDKKASELTQLEKRFEIEKRSSSEQIGKLEKSESALKDELTLLTNRKEHYEAQILTLTAQLKETDLECATMRQKLAASAQEVHKDIEKERLALIKEKEQNKERISALNRENASLKADIEKQKHIVEKVNLVEFASYRRKYKHFSRLYSTMRGLKEMVEERNQNWEIALRALSTWVCQKNNKNISSEKIGVLVGEALEAIGETLLIEDEALPSANHLSASYSDSDAHSGEHSPADS